MIFFSFPPLSAVCNPLVFFVFLSLHLTDSLDGGIVDETDETEVESSLQESVLCREGGGGLKGGNDGGVEEETGVGESCGGSEGEPGMTDRMDESWDEHAGWKALKHSLRGGSSAAVYGAPEARRAGSGEPNPFALLRIERATLTSL